MNRDQGIDSVGEVTGRASGL